MESDEQKFKASNQIKTICMVVGIVYSGFATFMLGIVFLQKLMVYGSGIPTEEVTGLNSSHNIFFIFLPLVILLGIAYIKFGFSFSKTPIKPILVNNILRIVSAIISVSYSIVCFRLLILGLPGFFSITAVLMILSSAFGFFIVILVFNLPQYFISKKIKKYYSIKF